MAFAKSGWAVDGRHQNPNIPRVHSYTSTDALADVNTAGYFNDVAAEVSVGDIIECYLSTGGTPTSSTFYVNANDGTTVDVVDGVSRTNTDSD